MPTLPLLTALVVALAAALAVLVAALRRRERGGPARADAAVGRLRERAGALRARHAELAAQARLPDPAPAPPEAARPAPDGRVRAGMRRPEEARKDPLRGARVPPAGRPREPRPAPRTGS